MECLCFEKLRKEYENKLADYYKSSIRFENLPTEISSRFVENTLYEKGRIIFFKHNQLGYVMLPHSGNIYLDIYNRETKVQITANNGFNIELVNDPKPEGKKEFYVVYDSISDIPPIVQVRAYSTKLALIEQVIWLNVNTQKQKTMFRVKKNSGLTPSILKKKFDDFDPILIVDKSIDDIVSIEQLDISQDYNIDKLYMIKNQIENEALEFCGIVNNGIEKKERLTNDEIMTENSGANVKLNNRLQSRIKSIESINKEFNLQIQVKTYQDFNGLGYEGEEKDNDSAENKHLKTDEDNNNNNNKE